MKNFAIGSVALLAVGLAGPAALAADMPARPLPPPIVVANWTGCYVGFSIGQSWGRSKHEAVTGTTAVRGGVPVTLAAGTVTVLNCPARGRVSVPVVSLVPGWLVALFEYRPTTRLVAVEPVSMNTRRLVTEPEFVVVVLNASARPGAFESAFG